MPESTWITPRVLIYIHKQKIIWLRYGFPQGHGFYVKTRHAITAVTPESRTAPVRIYRISPSGKPTGWFKHCLHVLLLCCVATGLLLPTTATGDEGEVTRGHASWYGDTAHGKRTANGETFNQYSMTAAHKELPFGLVLRIRNLNNGRQTLVRLNDRGPYIEGRDLDISQRAAIALNMLNKGTAPISYEIISDRRGVPLNKKNAFYIHIDNVKNLSKARAKATVLAERFQRSVTVVPTISSSSATHALYLGPYKNFRNALTELLRCENENPVVRGIIEAPAKASEDSLMVTYEKKSVRQAQSARAKQASGPETLAESIQSALCGSSAQQNIVMVDHALGTFFGLHTGQPAVSLHHDALTDCSDLSL